MDVNNAISQGLESFEKELFKMAVERFWIFV